MGSTISWRTRVASIALGRSVVRSKRLFTREVPARNYNYFRVCHLRGDVCEEQLEGRARDNDERRAVQMNSENTSRQRGVRLKKHLAVNFILLGALMTGCAQNLAMLMSPRSARPPMQFAVMPRDATNVYRGVVHANSFGTGSITITVDARTYVGPFSKTVSKWLLLSTDNHELRCDMQDDGMEHGVGICVDDSGRVYDALLRK